MKRALTLLTALLLTPLAAPPAAGAAALWQIGRHDTNNAEFALAPNRYEAFEEDGLFIAGRSDAKTAWPYVHPGPDDSWAGARLTGSRTTGNHRGAMA